MTEAERVNLYNDLCDLKEDLATITYPPQTKQIDIINRAIGYVRGERANWMKSINTTPTFIKESYAFSSPCTCSLCHFANGRSDFKLCPNCGARMVK